nr:hypothetical protein [Fodinibius sp.]NIV12488.1 hypothetical protein [Fodinibius sp.]NIY26176.1 hypothetical protein [Fodinibius sp.]
MASQYTENWDNPEGTPKDADATDFFGTAWATWDIGCHEDSGVYAPTASASASPTSGSENLTVDFTGG